MRNLKKILALALALVMTFSLMTTANAFTDDKDFTAAYNEAATVLTGMGVIKGYTDGSFAPKASITRAEVAAIIYRVVTGDTTDKNVAIYSGYGKFTDVPATHWAAGYIGYCANAELVKGNGDDTFNPEGNVTGYQALAMILRAVGYDQNGEFTGNGWEVKVASTATQLGLLSNVTANLAGAAAREVVAEVIFQAMVKAYKVSYTPALGYQPISLPTSTIYTGGSILSSLFSGGTFNTLGLANFGLTSYEGYIVGNQATGEASTKVYTSYVAANSSGVVSFNYASDLSTFGHQTKVWYDYRTATLTAGASVYATFDKATNSSITNTAYAALTATAKVPYIATSAYYDDFTTGAATAPAAYNMVVNNENGTKALIGLYLTVDQYTAINNYTTYPTVSFRTAGTLVQSKVNGFAALSLGAYVNLNKVVGTAGSDATKVGGFYKYDVSALGIAQGTVSYVDVYKTITLNGVAVKYSYDALAATAAAIGLTTPATWSFVTTYNVYTDILGNYVAAVPAAANVSYLKAAYAYYQTSIVDGTIKYYVQGVDMTGAIQTVQLAIDAATYNALDCTKLNWLNNTITAGNALDMVLAPSTLVPGAYTIDHMSRGVVGAGNNELDGDCYWYGAAVAHAGLTSIYGIAGGTATVTATTVSLGTGSNYFVDANTAFYYMSGYGANLKVTSYQGIAALLNGNSNCVLPENAIVKATRVYTANIATENYHVDAVLIAGTPALTGVSTLVYVPTATVLGTGALGAEYDVYLNGTLTHNVALVAGTGGTIGAQTFYSYTKDAYGRYVLTAPVAGSCVENAALNKANAAGSAYLYVTDSTGAQRAVAANANIINLVTSVSNVPTTVAGLITALENNNITVDVEIVNYTVANVYIVGYTAK